LVTRVDRKKKKGGTERSFPAKIAVVNVSISSNCEVVGVGRGGGEPLTGRN